MIPVQFLSIVALFQLVAMFAGPGAFCQHLAAESERGGDRSFSTTTTKAKTTLKPNAGGDLSAAQLGNLSVAIVGGQTLSTTTSQAKGALPAIQNPAYTVNLLAAPSVQCAGNAGPSWTSGGAYGSVCMAMKPPSDAFGYKQTYLSQFDLMVPDMTSPEKNYAARDQVALYAETRMGSYGPAGWAFNFLAQANNNASTTLGGEIDLNNLSGCDSAGVDGTYTGGSAAVVATRSDGSACSSKIGLLITGIAGNTGTAGLQFQYVSKGSHDMWQDGIRMLGGHMASEYDWVSNTASISAFKIYGAHAQHAVDMLDGNFSGGAIALKSTDGSSGKIGWYCPKSSCVSGWPSSAGIGPASDGMMHVYGSKWQADNGFQVSGALNNSGTAILATGIAAGGTGLIVGTPPITPTIMSGVYAPAEWSKSVAEWYVGSSQIAYLTPSGRLVMPQAAGGLYVGGPSQYVGAETHLGISMWKSPFIANGGMSASNYILHGSGAYVFDNSSGAAVATINYDQPKGAIKISSSGLELTGSETIAGNLGVKGSTGLGVSTVAGLPGGCTPGQLLYASDGRKPGEAAAAGSGTPVICTLSSRTGAAVWAPIRITATAVTN